MNAELTQQEKEDLELHIDKSSLAVKHAPVEPIVHLLHEGETCHAVEVHPAIDRDLVLLHFIADDFRFQLSLVVKHVFKLLDRTEPNGDPIYVVHGETKMTKVKVEP